MKHKRFIAILAAQLIMSAALLIVLRLDRELFAALCHEDFLVEYLTAALFLGGGGIALCAALRAYRGRLPRITTAGFAVLAFGLAFVGMEEISWGQRIFGWSTPEAFAELNWQHETSIHNLATDVSQKAAFAASLLFGVALPATLALSAGLRRFYERLTGLDAPGTAAVYCCLTAYAWCRPEWLLPTLSLVITVILCGALLIQSARATPRHGTRLEVCMAALCLLVCVTTRALVRTTGVAIGVEVAEEALALAAFLLTAGILPPREAREA